jgi:hypothetical protein
LKDYLYDLEELIGFMTKASNRISTVFNDGKVSKQLQKTDALGKILSTTTKTGYMKATYTY